MTLIEFIRGALINLFVLLGFVSLSSMLRGWSLRNRKTIPHWQTGILFGTMALVAMLTPVATSPGMIFDCRSGVIGTGALLAGPTTAVISIILPIAYRLYHGGIGTIPGLLEILLPAALGSLCYAWLQRRNKSLNLPRILVSSLIVGVGTNTGIISVVVLALPETTVPMGTTGTILVMLNAPVSMILLSTLILLERSHSNAIDTLADSERRMLHSQKMAAVGQLSQRVAHTFANALTTVLGNAQLAKDHSQDPSLVSSLMSDLIEAVGRVSRLTAELLAFSSPGSLRVRRMGLNKCLVGIEKILSKTIASEIEVVINSDVASGKVDVDPDRIEQAILHMAVNASEAISGHGKLVISVSPADLSRQDNAELQAGTHQKDLHKGKFALLSIEDTGCGMTPETVSRIFEPFFTTKEKSENGGLGLSTVYNIVKQHNGYVDVQSRPDAGTTFLIYLPVVDD